jgi:hypothetical protein
MGGTHPPGRTTYGGKNGSERRSSGRTSGLGEGPFARQGLSGLPSREHCNQSLDHNLLSGPETVYAFIIQRQDGNCIKNDLHICKRGHQFQRTTLQVSGRAEKGAAVAAFPGAGSSCRAGRRSGRSAASFDCPAGGRSVLGGLACSGTGGQSDSVAPGPLGPAQGGVGGPDHRICGGTVLWIGRDSQ